MLAGSSDAGSGSDFLSCSGGVSDKVKNELLDYGAMQLRREVFSSDDLHSLLKVFNATKKLTTPQGEIAFEAAHSTPIQTFESSQSPYHPWPGCLYEMGAPEEEAWTTRERVIFAGAKYSETVMNLIRRGETDTVEFKEFIRLDDKKAADIVKAVISFANPRGGTIFIGVTDDADIVGVEAHVPHDKRKAATFEADYFAGVRRLLQQKLNRIPPIETRSEQIGDKTVFVLRVAEGAAKPYANAQTRETFVRRDASDVRPDPDTDLKQMLESGGERLPLHWYRP